MIAGALLLLVLPLAMAGIVYILVNAKTLSGLLSIITALVTGLAVIALPLEEPIRFWGGRQIAMGEAVSILGRELVLEPSDRLAMAFIFFAAAVIFALAWRVKIDSLLYPIGLGLLSLLSASLLIRPLIYGALLLETAAVLAVFALQPGDQPPTRGALRYVTFTTLALPGLMVTHWLLERYALTPNETGLLSAAGILLSISFAMLLGVVPFHTWVTAVSDDGMPLSSAFVLTVNNSVVWFLFFSFLETYPSVASYLQLTPVIGTVGVAMAVLGGLLAAKQQHLGRLMGYSALADTGCALAALGMQNGHGVVLVMLSLLVRPVGLALMATGVGGIRADAGDDQLDGLRSVGWSTPFATLALLIGGMSAAGAPLTAGFVWRWALYRDIATRNPTTVVLLLLSSAGVVAGLIRALATLLHRESTDQTRVGREGRLFSVFVIGGLLACVVIGVFPQLIAPFASRLAESYRILMP
ncbi:MAG: hypothetical protein GX620_16160 [Chloroflexi bacterium]|nr:hypothetical protein [Chloroflexota bacterium]